MYPSKKWGWSQFYWKVIACNTIYRCFVGIFGRTNNDSDCHSLHDGVRNVSSLHVYFVGNTGSTNSDSDCQSLHDGVCTMCPHYMYIL